LTVFRKRFKKPVFSVIAEQIGIGVPTLKDIVKELLKPGRDPRDELPNPFFSPTSWILKT
jgi:uncharacterized protein